MCWFYCKVGYFCGKSILLTRRYENIISREKPKRFPLYFREMAYPFECP